jgi:hypothetical protein
VSIFTELFRPRLRLQAPGDATEADKPVLLLKAHGSYGSGSSGRGNAVELRKLAEAALQDSKTEHRDAGDALAA